MRIIIAEFMDAPAVERLRAEFDVVHDAALVDRPNELRLMLHDATGLIVRNRTQVRGEMLDEARLLRVVGRLGVGLDNIDVAACAARGIEVIPATGANTVPVGEYVVTTAMMLLRGAYTAGAEVAEGKWPRPKYSASREIAGKTLGLIGFGGIGRYTAQLARALGMTVCASDSLLPEQDPAWCSLEVEPVSLEVLLARADVVSLHVPLTEQTRGLLGASRLALMKPTSVLINTARGGIVDEAALMAALKAGRLAGAALDVFADEPLPASRTYSETPNLLLTPHIAGVTAEANERVSSLIAERVAACLMKP